MDPEKKLSRLCRRYGVPREDADALLPLVERAAAARSPRLRKSLLDVVDSTLAKRAEDLERQRKLDRHLDEQYLVAVANVLHTWDPSPDS